MLKEDLVPIERFDEMLEAEQAALAKSLLKCCHQQQAQLREQAEQLERQANELALQSEQLALQSEQIQLLKDEIAVLKGEKARPKIKPSCLNKPPPGEGSGEGGEQKKARGRGKPVRKKTVDLEIH